MGTTFGIDIEVNNRHLVRVRSVQNIISQEVHLVRREEVPSVQTTDIFLDVRGKKHSVKTYNRGRTDVEASINIY